jgi:hypothetical protein
MQSRADTLDNSQASEKSTESVLLKQEMNEISNNNNRKKGVAGSRDSPPSSPRNRKSHTVTA